MSMKDFLRRHTPVSSLEEALKINQKMGGSRVISYGGKEVLVPARDIHMTLDKFRTEGDRYRIGIMESVNAALARNFPAVKNGTAKPDQMIKCAQDVAIWFANEVIEGRAQFGVN